MFEHIAFERMTIKRFGQLHDGDKIGAGDDETGANSAIDFALTFVD